ncbi:MAG TPA: DUF2380 domain-containing protein [Dongiaceae bacterium]|nr:DUF2380 domain-containing protein [Dongiaceae bacterium]
MLALAMPAWAAESLTLAIADFDYTDTSGETQDQKAAHAARLAEFTRLVGAELEKSGTYRIVALSCAAPPCTATRTAPDELIDTARDAGARLLLYGGVHKMSTLIQFGKAQAVGLEVDKLVFDQTVSFRGDDDEAWRRAALFLAEQILAADPAKP